MNYAWKRFWCPRQGSISLADGGYLVDPDEDHAAWANPDVAPYSAIETHACLGLLGEPGIGKSTAMQSIVASPVDQDASVVCVDLRAYGSEDRLYMDMFESSQVRDWLDADYVLDLFIDSLDECRLRIPQVANVLLQGLRNFGRHISRLRLRIACRTAEWPAALERGLTELFGEDFVGIYELAPLRRSDVALAATVHGLDSTQFLNAVARSRAQAFSIKPVTLRMLLAVFQQTGMLPARYEELYEKGCRQLCVEYAETRSTSPAASPEKRLAVASRIAAMLVFCNKAAVVTNDDESVLQTDYLRWSDVVGGQEALLNGEFDVDEPLVKETLNSALFSGRGPSLLGFAHQTYAEYLAARYVTKKGLELSQVLGLVEHNWGGGSRRVVPQLAESAAWLATMDIRVFRAIMSSDPYVLLRSDVAKADESERASLVASLLDEYDAETINDADWNTRRLYKELDHPTLSSQLLPYIRDRTKGVIVRRVSIDIAEACELGTLQSNLADIALDVTELHHIRDQAAHAVATIGDASTRERLKPLATEARDDDPDDQLKGSALRSLWPDHLTVDDLFASLTRPKDPSLHGAYSQFVQYELVDGLSLADLPATLAWIADLPSIEEPYSLFRSLVTALFDRAWDHLEDTIVFEAFVDAALSRIRLGDYVFHGRRNRRQRSPVLSSTDDRRRVLRALLPRVAEMTHGAINLVTPERFVFSEDVLWMLESLSTESDSTIQKALAVLIRLSFDPDNPLHIDQIIKTAQRHDLLADEMSFLLSPVLLGSDKAIRMKEDYELSKDVEQNQPALDPPLRERIERALASFEAGNADAWWLLNREMTLTPTSTHYDLQSEREPDLRSLPGWAHTDLGIQQRIVHAAEAYLQRADPHTEEWLGTNVLHRPAAAGYRAILLLKNEDPQGLDRLQDGTWVRWAPVCLALPESMGFARDEASQEIVELAYLKAPIAVREVLLRLIDKENEDGHDLLVIRRVDSCWDGDLQAALEEKVADTHLNPSVMQTLLVELLEHGSSEAMGFARTLLTTPALDELAAKRRLAAAVSLCATVPEQVWPEVWGVLQREQEFAEKLLQALAHGMGDRASALLGSITDRDLADLYLWLALAFPHSEAANRSGVVTPRQSVKHLRDSVLLKLQNRGTASAVSELQRIRDQRPDLADMIKWTIFAARDNALRATWKPPTPHEVLQLTQTRGSQLVRNAYELSEVVLTSLQRLNVALQAETPAAPDLWDEKRQHTFRPKDENHLSDYIKRHLERELRMRGIVSAREVEIRRGEGRSAGERTDIHVTAVVSSLEPGQFEQARVIIEVKGSWHAELFTAMETQLCNRYLHDNDCQHGIYVVGWYSCPQWDTNDRRRSRGARSSLEDTRSRLEQQARSLRDQHRHVSAFVLNAALR